MNKFDAIIIGFGKGGKTLATELANRKWKVAVIERSKKMYGGTCINIACIPTKSLAYQAHQGEDYIEAVHNKDQLISSLRQKNYDNLNQNENIEIINGEASFLSEHELQVKDAGETKILTADKIFINTGAETIIPTIDGIQDSKFVYTSTSIMDLRELPTKLAIIGGGYIGLEFASIYSQFGSQVTVLEGSSKFIPKEDRDVADAVLQTFTKKNIEVKLNAKIIGLKDVNDGAIISYTIDGTIQELEVDAVLVATGRKPNIEGLNLEAAGVEVTDRGAIKVDPSLKTTVPHIWALGDVKGGLQFTYISLDDYRIVRNDLFGDHSHTTNDRDVVPYSVFIDPPLSRVGISEEAAVEQGLEIKVAKLPSAAIPRARLINETEGFLKAIVDAKTNKILGATLFCAESSEVINIVSMAIQTGQDFTFLRDHIFTHPTMSEALNDLFSQIKE
ncbi:pyruvate/2-oxoglutarate dehydrogenase complex dihydrolipoamide dehydrogenase (E3) component [Paenibacillus sp. PastF-3]|uniref:FAD-dependent oxidoreductase n=1 Tax=Paenibacillus sp. PastF-3 TaxID=2940626 RepID=UPI002474CEA7|nr:FAD-dependent oxidoreductase [Paenibacillus sp. PastF-3]MDH6370686.1 pyruvate/2-oxoglutarate dehydrogenase complex dihydrolipoamide dehydrogenase (E3) component [Paenibacillus sp. PastF-3]